MYLYFSESQCFPYIDLFVVTHHNINADRHKYTVINIWSGSKPFIKDVLKPKQYPFLS